MHPFLATLTMAAIAGAAAAADALRLELIGLPDDMKAEARISVPSFGMYAEGDFESSWDRHGRLAAMWHRDATPEQTVGWAYGVGLASSGFELEEPDYTDRLAVLGVQVQAGVAIHAAPWLTFGVAPYVGVGVSAYESTDNDPATEEFTFDPGLAWEVGFKAAMVAIIAQHVEVGVVAGWMHQRTHNEGTAEMSGITAEAEITTITQGGFGGLLVGYRF